MGSLVLSSFFPIEGIVYSNGVLQRIKQFSRGIKQKRIKLLWLKMAAAVVVAVAEWCPELRHRTPAVSRLLTPVISQL